MKTVINKTRKPLRIPLPGGKALFLGITQEAKIRDDALEHAPVKKLLEMGDIEVFDGPSPKHGTAGGGGMHRNEGGQRFGGKGKMQTGDR
ncbi:MAG: hypothetical protein IIA30_12440 [Myxococcales bacterium]|nr:hypothetical protein [Myxococcales bacterium]